MDNDDKIILDLCGGTGAWSKPYKDAGYDVRVITLPEYDVTQAIFVNERIVFQRLDIAPCTVPWRNHAKTKDIYGILAAPPCTMFSLARTRAKTPRDLRQGMEVVRACMDIIWTIQETQGIPSLKFWALENPMGILRRFLGRPKFSYDPCDYGDHWTKRTDIWGWFNEPKKRPIKLSPEEELKCKHNNRKLPSISDFTGSKQSARRAITPPGFAQAFFKANK